MESGHLCGQFIDKSVGEGCSTDLSLRSLSRQKKAKVGLVAFVFQDFGEVATCLNRKPGTVPTTLGCDCKVFVHEVLLEHGYSPTPSAILFTWF